MKNNTNGKEFIENKDAVRMELDIERLPEIFNKQAYKNGVQTIVRRNQKMEIGLEGSTRVFSHHEYLVFLEVLQMWHELGRPESGEIYRENDPMSLCEFTDNLYGGERKFRTGGNYRTKIERWIKNLMKIPLVQHILTPLENGNVHVKLGSFTFLSEAEGIRSKNGRYFDLSKIKIHPAIVKSILSHHMKPVRLDVIRTLNGDNETLFYRELDLMLSRRRDFAKPLIHFCNDLGIKYKQERDYTSKAKKICKRLIGKPLSSKGEMIAHCFTEMRDGVQWIVAAKAAIETPEVNPPKESPRTTGQQTKTELEFEKRIAFLKDHFDQFSNKEKTRVYEKQKKLLETAPFNTKELTIETCFLKAVESVLHQELTKEDIFVAATDPQAQCVREGDGPPPEYKLDPTQKPSNVVEIQGATVEEQTNVVEIPKVGAVEPERSATLEPANKTELEQIETPQ